MARPTLEELLEALEQAGCDPKPMPGGYYKARCPAHEDRHPSLALYPRGKNGFWLECFAGCRFEKILGVLGLDWEEHTAPEPAKRSKKDQGRELVYPILEIDGTLLAHHVRVNLPNGGKSFYWQLPEGTKGLDGLKVEDLPLFGSERIPMFSLEKPVIVTEGEKAATALRHRGYQVLGTVTGAATIPNVDVLKTLTGFRVILWPDNDEPGRLHMFRIARRLRALGIDVCRIPVPDSKPKGWDAADAEPSEIEALLAAAEPWEVEPERIPGRIYTVEELKKVASRALELIVPGLLPEGVTLLAGRPKRGKSWLALQIGLAVSSGGRFARKIGIPKPRPVLFAALEDGVRRITARIEQLQDVARPGNFGILTDMPPLPEGLELLAPWARENRGGLIILDTLSKILRPASAKQDLYLTNYNIVQNIAEFATMHGVSFLCVFHTRKGEAEDPLDAVIGSTGYTAAVDTVLVLRGQRGDEYTELAVISRDLPENSFALKFDPDHAWTYIGPADQVRLRGQKRLVLEALEELGGQATTAQLARALGLPDNHVRPLLARLISDGFVKRHGDGVFVLREHGTRGEVTL